MECYNDAEIHYEPFEHLKERIKSAIFDFSLFDRHNSNLFQNWHFCQPPVTQIRHFSCLVLGGKQQMLCKCYIINWRKKIKIEIIMLLQDRLQKHSYVNINTKQLGQGLRSCLQIPSKMYFFPLLNHTNQWFWDIYGQVLDILMQGGGGFHPNPNCLRIFSAQVGTFSGEKRGEQIPNILRMFSPLLRHFNKYWGGWPKPKHLEAL